MSLHLSRKRHKEVDKEWQDALKRTDRMTEREKLRTSGLYYAANRNFDMAIDTFKELLSKYQADSAGHNNLAVAYFGALNFASALEHGRRAIEIYPKSFKFRSNFALYAMYAGDFKTAAATAQELVKENPSFEMAYLPLAMEALASGDANRATVATTSRPPKAANPVCRLARSGLPISRSIRALRRRDRGSCPMRSSATSIRRILSAPWPSCSRSPRRTRPAAQQAAGAGGARPGGNARRRRQRAGDGGAAVAGGRSNRAAKAIAAKLGQRLPAQSRAYGKLIEGEIALAAKRYPEALDALNAARKLADLWLVRYVSGHAYFQRGDYLEASAEFTKCQERRGEATAVFLDDLPTFRYYAPCPTGWARARDARLDARTQYQEFLRSAERRSRPAGGGRAEAARIAALENRHRPPRLNTAPCGMPFALPPCGQVLSSIRKPGSAAPSSRKRASHAS